MKKHVAVEAGWKSLYVASSASVAKSAADVTVHPIIPNSTQSQACFINRFPPWGLDAVSVRERFQFRRDAGARIHLEHDLLWADGEGGFLGQRRSLQRFPAGQIPRRETVPRSEERRVGKECRSRWS